MSAQQEQAKAALAAQEQRQKGSDAPTSHDEKISKALKEGERVGGLRFRDAVNIPCHATSQEYETVNSINGFTGGVKHKQHWRMYLVGPHAFVWHALARKVVRVPMSNIVFIEEYEP